MIRCLTESPEADRKTENSPRTISYYWIWSVGLGRRPPDSQFHGATTGDIQNATLGPVPFEETVGDDSMILRGRVMVASAGSPRRSY